MCTDVRVHWCWSALAALVHFISREPSLPDIIGEIRAAQKDDGVNLITTSRGAELGTMIDKKRKDSFMSQHKLSVKFSAEAGIDAGALSDVFFQALMDQLPMMPIFHTHDDGLRLAINVTGAYYV